MISTTRAKSASSRLAVDDPFRAAAFLRGVLFTGRLYAILVTLSLATTPSALNVNGLHIADRTANPGWWRRWPRTRDSPSCNNIPLNRRIRRLAPTCRRVAVKPSDRQLAKRFRIPQCRRAQAILSGREPATKTPGGGGGNRTRVQGFEKRAMARDFRC